MQTILEFFFELWQYYKWRMIGVFIALVVGIMFLTLGFFKTIFLLLLIGIGYILGQKMDDKEDIVEFIKKIFSYKFHR